MDPEQVRVMLMCQSHQRRRIDVNGRTLAYIIIIVFMGNCAMVMVMVIYIESTYNRSQTLLFVGR